jgi:hypothetical protein
MKIPFVGKSLWFMQNNNGVKQRFLDCFLKILDKKRKKWRELLPELRQLVFIVPEAWHSPSREQEDQNLNRIAKSGKITYA